jgi:hypothetical protein
MPHPEKIQSKNNLVVAIYYHPEAYPPTLNAVEELSASFDTIEIVYRPNIKGTWIYPANVTAYASGNFILARDQETSPVIKKLLFFKKFTLDFLRSCRKKKPSCILIYDSLALLSYYLIRHLISFEHKVWYHNHDVLEKKLIRKYSLSWFAYKAEETFINKLDIFSLPANERLPYFDTSKFTGKYFCIPNYPSLKFYKQFYSERKLENELRIIFQGRIDRYHGIEEIIPILKYNLSGHTLRLILKGHCDTDYQKEIENIAETNNVRNLLEIYGFSPYAEVPRISSGCHIGIGIFAKKDIMNETLGTASNKVYEYAAVGLPVLYLENSTLKKYLEKFCWALPVQMSSTSIRGKIEEAIANYSEYSKAAYDSFCKDLNFEYHFAEVKTYVESVCK